MKLVAILLLLSASVDGYKILMLLPFPGPSHFLMFKVIIKELINRGHEVASISAFPFNEKLSNYTEILIKPEWKFDGTFTQEQIYDMKYNSQIEMLFSYWWIGTKSAEHALRSAAVQDFIKNDNSKFDLIFAEQYFQESMLMFAHKYKAPIVTLCTYGTSDFMDRAMGGLTPYSFVPHMMLSDYEDKMSFLERAHNLAFSMIDVLIRRYRYMPAMEEMARKYFSHLKGPLPSVAELEKSISVIFTNYHFAMTKPRPLMPGMINIAGAHMKPIKPLPEDIGNFLDNAEYGAIYMSLGSYLQSSMMPKEKMGKILKVFASLKQRVLWKFETDDLPELPSNVMVSKWMPQSDILAHPKLVLFISHGGLYGTIETSFYGVPVLFMPFFADQFRNSKLAESRGYAERILFSDVNEERFKSKIQKMVSNPKYLQNAKEIAGLMNDNPLKPMDEIMYWVEYVVRHKGAKHLKSHAVNLTWYEYLMLDVISIASISLWLMWKLLRLCLSCLVSKIFPKKITAEKMNGKKRN